VVEKNMRAMTYQKLLYLWDMIQKSNLVPSNNLR
jgi:hypothetical protein